MIKRTFFLLSLILISSCGSYNSIDSFYEAHKNDDQVTAVRVPRFMLSLLGNISPEMNSLIGNTRDLRYMQFPSATPEREKRDAVKEILIYNNNTTRGSFLYFNGNFDPVKVREMAKNEDFQKIGEGLMSEFNMGGTPGINQEEKKKEEEKEN